MCVCVLVVVSTDGVSFLYGTTVHVISLKISPSFFPPAFSALIILQSTCLMFLSYLTELLLWMRRINFYCMCLYPRYPAVIFCSNAIGIL